MRPQIEHCPSPNFRKITYNRKITCVVLHATATSGLESPKDWLTNPDSKVSAHYLIGRDGACFQLVSENDVAWHAGESSWDGQSNVNSFSIGIELVNANDGIMDYSEHQLASCALLVSSICSERNIKPENVIGHLDIAPGRKTDPAGFPWDSFRRSIVEEA